MALGRSSSEANSGDQYMFPRNAVRLVVCRGVAMVAIALFSLPARPQNGEVPPVAAESDVQLNARRVEHRGAVLHVIMPESVTSDMILLTVMLQNRGREVFQVGETGYLLDSKVSVISD